MLTNPQAYRDEIKRLNELNHELVDAIENWRTWFSENFEDFNSEINAQLLCLDNDSAASLAKAKVAI